MRVLVTRPEPQASDWARRLVAAGFDAVALPLIEIAPPPDSAPVAGAWRSLSERSLVVFVSPAAVLSFFGAAPPGCAWPPELAAGSTGPGTTSALRACGVDRVVEPDRAADRFDSEALWQQLAGRDWQGRDVLIVRGDGGREWLAEQIKARGARVDPVCAYVRRAPRFDGVSKERFDAALREPSAHLWFFTSSQAIDHLQRLAPAGVSWRDAHALTTHARIAQRASELGIVDVAQASAGFEAVLASVGRSMQSFDL